MANSKEIHTKIKDLFEEFDTNHEIHSEKGNKAAGGRARKAIGEIKKLVTAYRKASIKHISTIIKTKIMKTYQK